MTRILQHAAIQLHFAYRVDLHSRDRRRDRVIQLSFLGLGVKFPFASWGNIINDVNNTFVLTSYWFIWIPAGVCLMLTVLAFNLVGDGLRDAFDPKMKR